MNAKCLEKYTVYSRQQISVLSLLPMHINVLMSRQISHIPGGPISVLFHWGIFNEISFPIDCYHSEILISLALPLPWAHQLPLLLIYSDSDVFGHLENSVSSPQVLTVSSIVIILHLFVSYRVTEKAQCNDKGWWQPVFLVKLPPSSCEHSNFWSISMVVGMEGQRGKDIKGEE